MHPLDKLAAKDPRRVVGLMSGTSLDGIDVAVVSIGGSGRDCTIETLGTGYEPYPDELRTPLMQCASGEQVTAALISQLNVRLAIGYAEAVRAVLRNLGLPLASIDLVGSHGQTIHHQPIPEFVAARPTMSTLQIGDPSTLANLLGIPVVGDFRTADVALGGQGAPLASYFDWAVLGDARENRVMLNLGGIANVTLVPRGGVSSKVVAFDTGPSNVLVDIIARKYVGVPLDDGGAIAATGRIHHDAVRELMEDPYFTMPPPKSTGREYFNAAFAESLVDKCNRRGVAPAADLLATACELSAVSIAQACDRFLAPFGVIDRVVAAGGGVNNAYIMERLGAHLGGVPIVTTAEMGVEPNFKEAIFFALFASEAVNGQPANLPSATGASRPTILGKICIPL